MSKLLTVVLSEMLVLLNFYFTKSAELLMKEYWEYRKGLKAVPSHFSILEEGDLVHNTIGAKGIPCLYFFGKP